MTAENKNDKDKIDDFAASGVEQPDLSTIRIQDWGTIRAELAKQWNLPVHILDQEYRAARRAANKEKKELDGQSAYKDSVEPWPHVVRADDLLAEIVATVNRFVMMPAGSAETIALWVVASHALDCFTVFPYLCFSSPSPACGKTSALGVIGMMVNKPLHASNVTPAALFRVINMWQPTLLIDECETFLKDNDEARGILNCGHARAGAFVIRNVGGADKDYEPRRFSTWGAKVLALIGRLPATLSSRSIVINLKRAVPGQSPERMRPWKEADLGDIARKCATWVSDRKSAIQDAADDPQIDGVYGRARDNWEPLIAIADAAGGKWPIMARRIIVKLSADVSDADETVGVQLVHDIHAHFAEHKLERCSSEEIVHALSKMEDRPWPEWRMGKPMTPTQLAKVLEPFSIRPANIRISSGVVKGYHRRAFTEIVRHYPNSGSNPENAATPLHPKQTNGFDPSEAAPGVAGKRAEKPQESNACSDVAAKTGVEGQKEGVEAA